MSDIEEAIRATQWIDTHEHLLEESERLSSAATQPIDNPLGAIPALNEDWSALYLWYAGHDLISAGMPQGAFERFRGLDLSPVEKWDLFEPYWLRCRNTGYMQAASISVEMLYGLALSRATCAEITMRMRTMIRTGYYHTVLNEKAGVSSCQVNSLRHVYCETEYPELLRQDLSILGFCQGRVGNGARISGISVESFGDFLKVIDWHFERYGRKATAVKTQWAYTRGLQVDPVERDLAERLFHEEASGRALGSRSRKPLEDFLFNYCLERAADYSLPVKLHTGYYSGTNRMPLARVRDNLSDLCPLFVRYPNTNFILMHIAYPYQHELIALAKQYTNVVADMCWTWIIDPVSSCEFVQRFLVTAPQSKLLCFGGDYLAVENVVGHAELARRGLTRALEGLVSQGQYSAKAALDLVPDLMRGNAERLMPSRPAHQFEF